MLTRPTARRRGMTTVETALVLSVFCMLLFGVFEYSRFLFILHVSNNGARDGARYAAVNLDKPNTFDTTDYTDSSPSPTTFTNIQRYTSDRIGGGAGKQVGGFAYTVAVYAVDPVGLTLTPPVIRPKSANPPTYPDPFNAGDPNKVAWNTESLTPTDPPAKWVAVTVKGDYLPLLPGFLFMPSSVPIYVTSMAGREG